MDINQAGVVPVDIREAVIAEAGEAMCGVDTGHDPGDVEAKRF